jgi:hypothetical protein
MVHKFVFKMMIINKPLQMKSFLAGAFVTVQHVASWDLSIPLNNVAQAIAFCE